MNDAITDWLKELGTVPNMLEPAERIGAVLHGLYLEGDRIPDAAELYDGLRWIAAHSNKPAVERLGMMQKLLDLESPAIVDLEQFTGWKS
jgi:hypothetical protein